LCSSELVSDAVRELIIRLGLFALSLFPWSRWTAVQSVERRECIEHTE